jgi:hypothetical protein
MITRREVLIQLKRIGANKQSLLKRYLRDFEEYMLQNYGLRLDKTKKEKTLDPPDPDFRRGANSLGLPASYSAKRLHSRKQSE